MSSLIHFPFLWMDLLCVTGFIIGTFYLWIHYENLDDRKYRKMATQSLFHCVKCGELFQIKGNKETADCPACNKNNLRLRF
jgi:rubrerythrin